MIFDYPYTDMHELNLDWFLAKFKELVEEWNRVEGEWTSLHDYVQNYFDNLNVQTEIDNKINAMITDGSFATILTPLVEATLPTIVDGKLPSVVASQIGTVVASQIDAVVAGQLPAVAASAAAAEVGDWLAAHIDPDTGYVIDTSLTVQNAAADAKKVGDTFIDVTDMINNIASIPFADFTQNADFLTGRDSYYTGPNGWVEGSTFYSYWFFADSNFQIYWDAIPDPGASYTQISIFRGCATYEDASSSTFVIRCRNSDSTLPIVTNKLSILKGDLVVFSVYKSSNAFTAKANYLPISEMLLANNVVLNSAQLSQIDTHLGRSGGYLQYISGTGNDASTERIEVFMSTNIGYVMYQFVHSIDVARNADIWRIAYAMAYDETFTKRYDITTQGEWECALHLSGRDDFSGGYIHGDEIMSDVSFWIDGKKVDITQYTTLTSFNNLTITQASNLYDPSDHITVIADHGSRHIFNDGKLVIQQTVIWKVSDTLTQCYMAMFPPAKAVTDTYYTDKNFDVENIVTYPIEEQKVTKAVIFSKTSGVTAEFDINKYPTGYSGGDIFLIHDNGSGNYNKCYYAISYYSSPAITSGTEWKSETEYKIDICE